MLNLLHVQKVTDKPAAKAAGAGIGFAATLVYGIGYLIFLVVFMAMLSGFGIDINSVEVQALTYLTTSILTVYWLLKVSVIVDNIAKDFFKCYCIVRPKANFKKLIFLDLYSSYVSLIPTSPPRFQVNPSF
jgi:hypothetical protein